jgi:hypothetical protein
VTVVELLIVLAIIGVMTVVMVTGHTTFNKTILLSYTAYDVALTIRSAETYGLGSRITSGITSSNTGYGVHIVPGLTTFVLFADKVPRYDGVCHPLRVGADGSEPDTIPGNCKYDPGASEDESESVQSYTLGNGMKITDTYWYAGAGGIRSDKNDRPTIDMVFSRPNPKAFISVDGIYNPSISIDACFEITSPQGGVSHVYVGSTGQITVGSKECPS